MYVSMCLCVYQLIPVPGGGLQQLIMATVHTATSIFWIMPLKPGSTFRTSKYIGVSALHMTDLWTRSVITASDASSGTQPNKDFPIEGSCDGGASINYSFRSYDLTYNQKLWWEVFFGYFRISFSFMAKLNCVHSAPRAMTPVSTQSLLGMV